MSDFYLNHIPQEGCDKYLPKPKRKYAALIVQCRWCGRFYRGTPLGCGWVSVELMKGEK